MESMEQTIWVAIFLVFVLLGLVILIKIVSGIAQPEQMVAIAHTESLRSAINEVCFNPDPGAKVTLEEFNLPQDKPNILSETILNIAKWIMKLDGDPHYVLYYEMFPPGEGIGWEWAIGLEDYRIIVPVKGGEEITQQELEAFIRNVNEAFNKYKHDNNINPEIVPKIFISNVILDEDFDASGGRFIVKNGETFEGSGGSAIGSWDTECKGDEQCSFIFSGYLGLRPINKTFIKYAACGDNTLCLKTRSGVYRYPLKYCKDMDYIGIYDKSGFVLTGTKKTFDFYLVSLCKAKIIIKKDTCHCKKRTFPIYVYDKANEKLTKRHGYIHTTCVDDIIGYDGSDTVDFPCIKIMVDKIGLPFCYTRKDFPETETDITIKANDYIEIPASGPFGDTYGIILKPTKDYDKWLARTVWQWP